MKTETKILSGDKLELSGKWSFRLDPEDVGTREEWYRETGAFGSVIDVPGAWQAQGFGDHKHYTKPCQQHGLPARFEMEKASYFGVGWYRKFFRVPIEWKRKTIRLCFGGTHPVAEFWINGRYAGKHAASALEHRHDATDFLVAGEENALTVRISEYPGNDRERDFEDPIQGGTLNLLTWSGLYREVFLVATGDIWVETARIVPNLAEERADIDIIVRGAISGDALAKATIVEAFGDRRVAGEASSPVSSDGRARLKVLLPHAALWSPETPLLYEARISLEKADAVQHVVTERFGMREFRVDGDKILLNGRPVWLRGYGDDQVYALTLSPYTDKDELRKDLKQAKAYGFNYVDFLYGVPHREYLDVADELGILVQCYPLWTTGRQAKRRSAADRDQLRDYAEKIVRQIHNHPAIMIYSVAAEICHYHKVVTAEIAELAKTVRALDPTRLMMTTGGVNRAGAGRDDTDILEMGDSHTCVPDQVDTLSKPVILHEYRWWSSYPDPGLREKYERSGVRPFFIDLAEQVAAEKGFSDLLPTFVENSRKLQAIERKIGVEKARRARGVNGYAVWAGKDLKEAVEGIWDDFGDPKNVSAETFRESNGETVLLIDKDYYYRCYWEGEKIPLELWLSHYGREPIANAALLWRARAKDGTVLEEGERPGMSFPAYETDRLCRLAIRLPKLTKAIEIELEVELVGKGLKIANHWNFWAFPKKFISEPRLKTTIAGFNFLHYDWDNRAGADDRELAITNALDEKTIALLEKGGRALLIGQGVFKEHYSEFKSNLWNSSDNAGSGTVVRPHPALGDFPHQGFCDLQFYGLLEDAPVVDLDAWPVKIDPIIRCIDSYKRGRNKAYLFEVGVGKGKLLVSSMNFRNYRGMGRYFCEVENYYLFDCLSRYALGDSFNPEANVSSAFLWENLKRRQAPEAVTAREQQLVFNDDGRPIAPTRP